VALRPVERLLLAYVLFTSAVGAARLSMQPAIGWVLLANLLTAILILLAARPDLGRAGAFLRELYPIVLLAALYPAIDILNNFGGVMAHDLMVRHWEIAIFGNEPSQTWWQTSPSVFWSTVLHAAYFAYYPVIVIPVLLFLTTGRSEAARRSVLWLLTTYLFCYAVFVLFPVAGPYYEFPRPAPWFLDNLPARLVYGTLAGGSAYGAAFPSSHVAATVVATAAAFRGSRPLGWVLVPAAALLTVGVVYCQMHYAVDAIAGVVLGAGSALLWIWGENRTGARPGEARRA
jgi:membrane-associated phospholipid phosphatase